MTGDSLGSLLGLPITGPRSTAGLRTRCTHHLARFRSSMRRLERGAATTLGNGSCVGHPEQRPQCTGDNPFSLMGL